MANRYTARLRLREANRCCGTVYRIHGGAVEVPGLGTPGQHRAESEGRRGGPPSPLEISRAIVADHACVRAARFPHSHSGHRRR